MIQRVAEAHKGARRGCGVKALRKIGLGAIVLFVLTFVGITVWAMSAAAEGDAGPRSNLEASTKTAECIGPAGAACSVVRYSILLANAGANMPAVSVFDKVPDGVQYVAGSAQGGLQYDSDRNALFWLGSLPAQSAIPLTFTARSLVSGPMTVTNAALICGDVCITRSVDVLLNAPPRPTPTATPGQAGSLDCMKALTMSLETRYYAGDTRDGASNVVAYGCEPRWIESGRESVYKLAIDRPVAALTITLQIALQDFDLFVLSDCDPLTCVTAGDRIVALAQPAGTYFIVVDGRLGAVGRYVLDLTWAPGPTLTPTVTPTDDPWATPTSTPTPTASATNSPTPTPTLTATPMQSFRPLLPLIFFRYPRPELPTVTPTPSYPISLVNAWIEGPKGSVNYSFRPCEVVYEYLRLRNYGRQDVRVWVDWIATDMSGNEEPALSYRDAGPFIIPGGHQADIVLPGVVPADAALGSYALLIRLRDAGGVLDSRTLYFSVSNEEATSSQLAELVLCRKIVDGLPDDVVAKDTFNATDEAAYAWTWWQRMGQNATHMVTWAWYQPDGRLYARYEDKFEGDCTSFAWGWIKIAGSPAANLPGLWRLEV